MKILLSTLAMTLLAFSLAACSGGDGEAAHQATDDAGDAVGGTLEGVSGALDSVADAAGDAVQDAGDAVGGAVDGAAELAADAADSVGDAVDSAVDGAGSALSDLDKDAKAKADELSSALGQ